MSVDEKQAIEELARLLDGDLPADGTHASVRQLASLATAVKDEIEAPKASPAFKASLRNELLEGIAASQVTLADRVRDAVWERTARWRHSAKLLVASATASTMVGTAGVAVAAQQALPGELLYPVKQVTEDVRMGFASGLQETGRLHLTFAAERLEELTAGVDGYDADTVIDLLEDMDNETLTGTEELLRVYEDTGNELILVVLERFAQQQREGLSAIFDRMPLEAAPFADRSLEILRRIEVKLEAIAFGCATCGAEGAGNDPGLQIFSINEPGEGPALGGEVCDCVGLLPGTLAREAAAGIEGILSGSDGSEDGADTDDGEFNDNLSVTVPSLPAPLDGAARALESTITSLTGSDSDSTTTDAVTGTVEDTTGTVEDTTSDTTGTVEDTTSNTTGTVEGSTSNTTGTVDEPTDSVNNKIDDTTGTVDDLLDDSGDALP